MGGGENGCGREWFGGVGLGREMSLGREMHWEGRTVEKGEGLGSGEWLGREIG